MGEPIKDAYDLMGGLTKFMHQLQEKPFMHIYPGLVAVVTVQHEEESNIMAAGWHSWLSDDPPMYGIAVGKGRYTYELIKNSGVFAVHFLPAEKTEIIQKTGVLSGKDNDKIKELQLETDPGKTINVPILRDAYVVYECQVTDQRSFGDHDWFAGKITACYKDEALFDENGLPNWDKLSIPLYLGRSEYYIANKDGVKRTYYFK